MNRVLILGATGYLGSRFFKDLENTFGTYLNEPPLSKANFIYFNACAPDELEKILQRFKPSVVINCIGFVNVDMCEVLPERNWMINSWAPYRMAQICKAFSVKFVHISTDHFVKLGGVKISESDSLGVVNQYGLAKYSGESAIVKANNKSLIIRTNFFHFNFNNPFTHLDRLLNSSKNLEDTSSFVDVYFTPVSTAHLTRSVSRLLHLDISGIVNVAAEYPISKYEFHNLILNQMGYSTAQHKPVSIVNSGLKAKRSLFMALDNKKFKALTGTETPALQDMIEEEILLARSSEELKVVKK